MAITQVITILPAAPDPVTMTRDQFSTAAAASVLAQKAMVPELNTWAGQVNAIAAAAVGDVATAIGAAAAATPVGADKLCWRQTSSGLLKSATFTDVLAGGTLPGAFTTLSASAASNIYNITITGGGGTPGTGGIGYGAANGIGIQGKTGTINDLSLWNAAGTTAILTNPTGTSNLVTGGSLAVTGQVSPSAHNTYDLGTTGVRWKDLWLQSGAFNGSDARLKTAVASLTANEINAAKQLSKEIGTYQWLESVQKKGILAARHHVGFTVQRAIEILQLNGCDPFSYGFIGYDKWEDVFVEHAEILPVAAVEAKDAVLDADGNTIEPAIVAVEAVEGKAAWTEHKTVAGDAYSFRYDQLNMFIAAGLEARLAALEAK